MCQADPGPRCYADSSKRLSRVEQKLERVSVSLAACNADMSAAASKKDFTGYAKAKKRADGFKAQAFDLQRKVLYIQRDVDGTKTGARMLRESMATASSAEELRALQNREKAAGALRYGRTHALNRIQSGYKPLMRIRGEVALAA